MHQTHCFQAPPSVLLMLALAAPGAALAYDEKDAIRDCESHIRSEYKLSDLRDATAERLNDTALHFKVQGLAKVDGDKHPWTCEVKNRHVTAAEYSGPKPKGMGTAEKLAIGAAAVIAGGVAINEASKHGGEGHSGSGALRGRGPSGPGGGAGEQRRVRAAKAAAIPTRPAARGATAPTPIGARALIASPCARPTGITTRSSMSAWPIARAVATGRGPRGRRGRGGRGSSGSGRRKGSRRRDRAAKPRL